MHGEVGWEEAVNLFICLVTMVERYYYMTQHDAAVHLFSYHGRAVLLYDAAVHLFSYHGRAVLLYYITCSSV